MKRLVWLTDIHLNFLRSFRYDSFFSDILRHQPDAVAISGDIGESSTVVFYLKKLEERLQKPIYFVLGNHDFYRSTFEHVESAVRKLCERSPRLVWLSEAGMVSLTPGTAIVGHDSWPDARLGNYERSEVMLNDYLLIEDLANLDKEARRRKMQARGDAAAAHFRHTLPAALARHRHVYVVTHVPPFREACYYEGKITSDDFLPHFGCKAVGDALREIMSAHPDHRVTVLCGHTHGAAQVQILDNLRVIAGGAEYGQPGVQQVFVLDDG